MIDKSKEELMSMSKAANWLSKHGRRVSFKTVYRWTTKGMAGVILESVQHFGRKYTSREALQRFFEAVELAREEAKRRRTPSDEIERRLDDLGL
jgi:hypothetical protein